jgi:competence protein ComFC
MLLKTIAESILEFIYPCECESCSELFSYKTNPFFCNKCLSKQIKYIKMPYCYKCGKPLNFTAKTNYIENILCLSCRKEKVYFDYLRPVLLYEDAIKQLIHYYKYQKYNRLYKMFGKILYEFINNDEILKESNIDFIVPIPLNKNRLKERGFNQSLLIADYLAKKFQWKIIKNCLLRKKNTIAQFQLKKSERKNNLKDAFIINQKYCNMIERKNILLIDDISTTNTTINECAKVLKKFNPLNIYAVVLAHGL